MGVTEVGIRVVEVGMRVRMRAWLWRWDKGEG